MAGDPAVSPGSTSFISTPSPTAPRPLRLLWTEPPSETGRCPLQLPAPHAVCSTSVAVTEPRDLPALPSGQRSPLPTSLLLVVSPQRPHTGPWALTSSLCRHLPRTRPHATLQEPAPTARWIGAQPVLKQEKPASHLLKLNFSWKTRPALPPVVKAHS